MGFQNWILEYPMHILSDLIDYSCEIGERVQESKREAKPMSLDEARKILKKGAQ